MIKYLYYMYLSFYYKFFSLHIPNYIEDEIVRIIEDEFKEKYYYEIGYIAFTRNNNLRILDNTDYYLYEITNLPDKVFIRLLAHSLINEKRIQSSFKQDFIERVKMRQDLEKGNYLESIRKE